MATILLLNFSEDLGARLKAFLRLERHDVWTAVPSQTYASWLRGRENGADLVIMDVSRREKYFWQVLEEIVAYRAQHGHHPNILCVSRVDRGAQFDLDLEKKGARLIYV